MTQFNDYRTLADILGGWKKMEINAFIEKCVYEDGVVYGALRNRYDRCYFIFEGAIDAIFGIDIEREQLFAESEFPKDSMFSYYLGIKETYIRLSARCMENLDSHHLYHDEKEFKEALEKAKRDAFRKEHVNDHRREKLL